MIDTNNNLYANAGLRTVEDNRTVGRSRSDLGQEDFLELMVAQLRNQDPMKPMENGDFLAQMAQFGTVQGIGDLQKSFESFSSSVNSGQALQASALIGRQVLADTDEGVLQQGGTLDGVISIPGSTPAAKVSIYNEAGSLVRSIDLGIRPAGDMTFSWDGTNDLGQALPPGTYRVAAEGQYEGKSEALGVMMGSRVDNVTLKNNGGMLLGLASGGSLDFSKVKQIM